MMALAAGSRLNHYQITAPLGAGGMGEVYRARDTRLQRDVAIKVLPTTFATDAERLARFEREARVLATLTHENIAHVYGIEESGGVSALVMELVEGTTLGRLRRRQHRRRPARDRGAPRDRSGRGHGALPRRRTAAVFEGCGGCSRSRSIPTA
jgi:serine/threonine protein kinase